ncbi:MAG: glucose 1-dehydrogenase [Desulfobacterales bacterium]|nr:glucose 1-dehydrogenase [Desulfobacteraceae bacterium]MBT7086944.1 glucose 1-dehydrogenase [Desulfobacterales bacterium]MBT7697346.1 glucose 1-dehydrogenase [Desulfobacterales bacterium]
MGRIEGEIALITGGAQGIGTAIAKRISEEGAKVVITDINSDAGKKTALDIGNGAIFIEHDVSSEDDWKKIINQIDDLYDGLDILINNAAICIPANIENADFDLWKKTMSINADSVFLGCKYGVESMKKSGGGSIVNISSMVAISADPFQACYAPSKAAVMNLTKSVALHCAESRYNIRCNSIHPGGIITPMYYEFLELAPDKEAARKQHESKHPMGRLGEPDEIANAVLFLASDEASFITGVALPVDGGCTAA